MGVFCCNHTPERRQIAGRFGAIFLFRRNSNAHISNRKAQELHRGGQPLSEKSGVCAIVEDCDESGLATLSRDRECAVRSAIHELEEAGHVTRLRQKNPDGTYNTVEYVIRETPEMETPPVEYPALENPAKDIPPAESRLQ